MKRSRLRLWMLERRDIPSTSIPLNETTWTPLGPAPVVSGQTPGGLPVSGRLSAVATHPTNPDIMYVGAAGGGVWKTTNATAANTLWTPLTDAQISPFVGCITLDPSNPNIIYIGTGEAEWSSLSFYGRGVLKSTDAGQTWTLLGSANFDRLVISNIVVHPTNSNIVLAAVGGTGVDGDPTKATGIFRSTDGGVNWVNISLSVTTVDGYSDLEVDPTNFNVMYAAVGTRLGGAADGVYKTTNALDPSPVWTLVSNLPAGSTVGRTEVAIAPSNNQVMYVSMQDPITAGVLKFFQSTNGGASWNDYTANVPGIGNMWYCNNLLVDKTAPNTLYYSGSTGLVRTTTGGTSFTSIASGANGAGPHVDHHDFAFDSLGRFVVGSDGGCYRWDSASNLWTNLNGLNQTRTAYGSLDTIQFLGIAIHPTDPDWVMGGNQDNGLLRFNDNTGWTLIEGGDGGDVILDPFNPNRMWRANPVPSYGSGAYLRRSTDGGETWSAITTGITNANGAAFYPPVAADPGTLNRIFHGTTVMNVSTDGGTNWGRLPGDTFSFPNSIRAIGIGPASSNIIYTSCGAAVGGTPDAAAANQIFVTTNGGVTWTERTPQLKGDFQSFAIDPTNSQIAYAVSANFSATGDNIWRTTNAGANWVSISGTLPDAPFYDVVLDPGPTNAPADDILYASGDVGVYRSTDLGSNWSKFGAGLPTVQVRDLEYSPTTKILAAGTHGRGVWEILTATPTTPGVIAGAVYNDANGNGTRDGGETGLAGWTVFRDDNGNGTLDTGGSSTISSTVVPVTLPQVGTASSTLTVTGLTGTVADVDVKLNVTHTYDGDFSMYLTSPSGTKVTLFSHIGGGGQNFTNTVLDDEAATVISISAAPFTGTFQATGLLAAFDGQTPNGTWTLSYVDPYSGDGGTLNSWSITVTTGEARTVSSATGAYQLLNQPTGSYSMRRVLQAGYTATEPLTGVQSAVLTPTQGAFNLNFGQRAIPAKIASVIIGDGTAQRSRVTQLKVVFDSIVNFVGSPAAAFQLSRSSPTGPTGNVALAATTTNAGHTEVTLTFSGPLSEFGSLIDGRYTLNVLASQFAGAGFDGDGNNIAGDNYQIVGTPANGLFRLFGDADGSGQVNSADFLAFRLAFLSASPVFDFDNSGQVNDSDFLQFRLRFLQTV
jgi:subtilisin-like proprotein convertase family protein